MQWYTKAAEQGDSDAQYHLGYFYEHGECVERDQTKAVEWYTKAAEQGHKTAQWILGCCYKHGDGVEKNYDIAIKWFTMAAEQGEAMEQNKLGDCYYYGDGVDKDFSKAVEWYTKAAEQGLAVAQYNLGYCYYWGEGVWSCEFEDSFCEEMNIMKTRAAEWFTKAAEQGFAMAQRWLGLCYQEGTGVEKDFSKAAEWYTKAAEQGNEDAKNALNRLKSIETKPIHYLFFDTETAGLPKNYFAPRHVLNNWPRLVQLSWITTDEDCNVLSQNDFIIHPDGFTIPSDASKLHGITTDIAKEKGKPLEEVMEKFMLDFNEAKAIVGHNIDFDKKILGAELIRLRQPNIMYSKKSFCTMEASTDYCRIPGRHGYKWPKLQELHKKLFGCEFEDAHNSMSDVTATLKCFKEMRKRGLI